MKKIAIPVTIALSLIFLFQLGVARPNKDISTEIKTGSETTVPEDSVSADSTAHKFLAYFFHGRKRCGSCRTIKAYAFDAIHTYFPEQIKSGRIEWRERNYANPEFSHFKDDFDLYTQSVVLVEMQGEEVIRWKNLKDVWTLIRDKEGYYDYIREEVESFLKEE